MMQGRSGLMLRLIVPLAGLVMVAAIGYVDYITGDYSMLIFYLVPVALVCWYHARWGGVLMAVASGVARFASDVSLYRDAILHYWNSVQDMVFLIVVGLLVSILKKELLRGGRA